MADHRFWSMIRHIRRAPHEEPEKEEMSRGYPKIRRRHADGLRGDPHRCSPDSFRRPLS